MLIISSALRNTGFWLKNSRITFCRNILRARKPIYKYPKLLPGQVIKHPEHQLTIDEELYNSLKGKVIYNCLVSRKNAVRRWFVRKQLLERSFKTDNNPSIPLSLKYKYGDSMYEFDEYRDAVQGSDFKEKNEDASNFEDSVNLPYTAAKTVEFRSDTETESNRSDDTSKLDIRRRKFEQQADVEPPEIIGKRWMSDYEVYEELEEIEEMKVPQQNYGTADPNVLPTKIPCGGCGAHLHCQSSSVPGFLPKEIFLKCKKEDFYRITCQRCTFLKNYNIALSVFVDPDAYPKLLSSVKDKNCCLILMVDMTDFPCSIWPNIMDLVGYDKPIMLVGNKIDLVPGDSPGWLSHAEKVLRASFPKDVNILSTTLISAKTGFGVEELITRLQCKWKGNGDVYLVGCTNVGKSSLFNALISSDYCKAKAVDIMQRATVSPWAGTTLNLLKFPILRMEAWRSFLRNQRLQKERLFLRTERQFEELQNKEDNVKISRLPKITGNIGRSFRYVDPKNAKKPVEEFVLPRLTNQFVNSDERPFLDPNDKDFVNSKWCYDTPGVVHHDQIINLLTTEELNVLITDSPYRARIFSIYVGQTLFIGGLARVDHIESEGDFMRIIVYSPGTLPITVCLTEAADEVYDTLLGTTFMKVPCGSANRMKKWPMLKNGEDIEITSEGPSQNSSEIVLSSAGWISFTGKVGVKSKMRPWTPEGRGIHLRKIPLLRYTLFQRRCRVSGTPTYYMKYL